MIRAPMGNLDYWNKWFLFAAQHVEKKKNLLSQPSENPTFDPQFSFQLAKQLLELQFLAYSRGDAIASLRQYFPGVLDAWILSNRLSDEVCQENEWPTCRDWDFSLGNLNHYNWCFWLVGLALVLEIPNDQWQRLLTLIGGEGEDMLLDRVIASRSPERHIGTKLLHTKPYARLLKAIDAPKDQQAVLLQDFVEHWYPELKRPAPKNRKAPTVEPFWYEYGDPEKNPLEMGSYFGRWCIEAVAAVKAFGLDDSLCLGHEYYPGDLLRPDGPSTHPVRKDARVGWFARIMGKK